MQSACHGNFEQAVDENAADEIEDSPSENQLRGMVYAPARRSVALVPQRQLSATCSVGIAYGKAQGSVLASMLTQWLRG